MVSVLSYFLEAKLSTEERKDLKVDDFGLPNERKYPLTDEEHVRKAIQFFKYCPDVNRKELATNINKKLKKFDMKVKVSRTNPFYAYIPKKLLLETITEEYIGIEYDDLIPQNIRSIYDNINKRFFGSEKAILTTEHYCYINFKQMEAVYMEINKENGTYLNPYTTINEILKNKYDGWIIFNDYIKKDISHMNIFYNVVVDIVSTITERIADQSIDDALSLLNDVCNIKNSNKYMVYRLLKEPTHDYFISNKKTDMGDMNYKKIMEFLLRLNVEQSKVIIDDSIDSYTIIKLSKQIKIPNTVNYLESRKNQSKFQLYIINKNTKSLLSSIEDFSDNIKVVQLLLNLNGNILVNNLKKIGNNNLSSFINDIELFKAYEIKKYCERIVPIIPKDDDMYVYCGVNGERLYLICGDNTGNNNLYFIEINDDNVDFFISENDNRNYNVKVITISNIKKQCSENESVTEGVIIDEDGNIKLSFTPKKSYMDEYAENHKLLVENWKNKNYEAVKQNLCFVFALISIMERSKEFKNKDKEVMKARAFALNDFKSYLTKLQKMEPEFNFVEYYNNTNYDKHIIDIPKTSIVGLKKLFKTIMMA